MDRGKIRRTLTDSAKLGLPQPRRRRSGLIAVACGLLIVAFTVQARASNGMALAPGDPSPDMYGWTLDGTLEKVEWQGYTLLNFWATWCEACRVEMPELQKLQEDFGEQGLRVYGLNREPATAEEIRTFLDGTGVQYPQLKPDKKLAKGWTGVNVLPTSYLVDAEGKILRKYVGAAPEQMEGMRADIENLVNGRQMGPLVIVKPVVTQTRTYETEPQQ